MEEKKEKRVLKVELEDDVKKVSITGLGDDEAVVMKQELSEEELDLATGAGSTAHPPGRTGSYCIIHEYSCDENCTFIEGRNCLLYEG